jgi:hypothetical protein
MATVPLDRTGLSGELPKSAAFAILPLSAGIVERRARRLAGNVLGEEFVEYLRPIDLVGFGRFRAFVLLERDPLRSRVSVATADSGLERIERRVASAPSA